jgi:hypothetical protein
MSHQPDRRISLRLTEAQRKVVAEITPQLAGHMKLAEEGERTLALTTGELESIRVEAQREIRQGHGMRRNSLGHVIQAIDKAVETSRGLRAIPAKDRLYQFRVSLLDVRPLIWRRFQVKEGTLDKLHERIQTAMGWTNSHLHHFIAGETLYGDPYLLGQGFIERDYEDSTVMRISEILPKDGERFRFEYEYDFGDSWVHEVLFEGCLRADPDQKYPLCVEGERACPPEDVGGPPGYEDLLEAIADPAHDQHGEFLEWAGGSFDPERFDPVAATKRMRRGLPNWRDAE